MPEHRAQIINIRRPKILMRAARMCAKGYTRERMLPRMQGSSSEKVLAFLQTREGDLEHERTAGTVTYSAQLHVEVLSALIAETKEAA